MLDALTERFRLRSLLVSELAKHRILKRDVKCGGPGSGKPGPCPQGKTDDPNDAAIGKAIASVMKHTGYTKDKIRDALSGRADPSNVQAAKIRARVTGSIFLGGTAIPDAANVLLEDHDSQESMDLVAEICKGDVASAQKEFADTPVYDLNVLTGMEVKTSEVPGEAVCEMKARYLTMGSTTRSGSYRHELGHAIRSALGGDSYQTKTAITKAIREEYDKVLARVAKDPQGIKTKLSHEEYETKYGVVGRRSLDNWEENAAEHYRLYHREIYRDRKEGGNGKYLAQYRERHPGWAKIWDAHYTAALIGKHLSTEEQDA